MSIEWSKGKGCKSKMTLVKRWLWLLVMVLGVICIVFGGFMIAGGRQAEADTIDGFSRTQVKIADGTVVEVNSSEDIDTLADYMKNAKYRLEDEMGIAMGLLEEGQTFDAENRVPDDVKYGLYFTFNEGAEGIPYAGYLPTVDGQLVFGSAKVVLGLSKVMEYTGLAVLIIGAALILVAVMLFGFTIGFGKLGSAVRGLRKS